MASLTTPGLLSLGAAAGFMQSASCDGGLECLGGALVGVVLLAIAFPTVVVLAILGPLALAGFPLGGWLWVRLGRRLARGLGDHETFRWRRWWGRYVAASAIWVAGLPGVLLAIVAIAGA